MMVLLVGALSFCLSTVGWLRGWSNTNNID